MTRHDALLMLAGFFSRNIAQSRGCLSPAHYTHDANFDALYRIRLRHYTRAFEGRFPRHDMIFLLFRRSLSADSANMSRRWAMPPLPAQRPLPTRAADSAAVVTPPNLSREPNYRGVMTACHG